MRRRGNSLAAVAIVGVLLLLAVVARHVGAQTQPIGTSAAQFSVAGSTMTMLSPATNLQIDVSGQFGWTGRSQIFSQADSNIMMTPNNTGSTLAALAFGALAVTNAPRFSILASQVAVNNNSVGVPSFKLGTASFTQLNLVLGSGAGGTGSMAYCVDCTIASPCAGGGTGSIAKNLNGTFVCN